MMDIQVEFFVQLRTKLPDCNVLLFINPVSKPVFVGRKLAMACFSWVVFRSKRASFLFQLYHIIHKFDGNFEMGSRSTMGVAFFYMSHNTFTQFNRSSPKCAG